MPENDVDLERVLKDLEAQIDRLYGDPNPSEPYRWSFSVQVSKETESGRGEGPSFSLWKLNDDWEKHVVSYGAGIEVGLNRALEQIQTELDHVKDGDY